MAQEPDLPPPDAGFEVVRRGYDQGQVDTHLRRLDAEIQILATDRDAALDQSAQLARELDDARARAERLRVQVRSLVSPPQSVQGMSERMRSMLRLAEDEAGEMLNQARNEAAQRLRDAETRATQILTTARDEAAALLDASRADADRAAEQAARERAEMAAELAAERERLTAERTAATERAAAEQEKAERLRAASWAASEARRKMIEEDFTIAMNRRRSEAMALLAEERERLEREVEATRASTAARARAHLEQAHASARQELEQARATAAAITDEAQRQVHALVALRGRLIEQLRGTRGALDESLIGLERDPDEVDGDTAGSNGRPVPDATPAVEPTPADRTASDTTPIADRPARATGHPAAAETTPLIPRVDGESPTTGAGPGIHPADPRPHTSRPPAGRTPRPHPERVTVGHPADHG